LARKRGEGEKKKRYVFVLGLLYPVNPDSSSCVYRRIVRYIGLLVQINENRRQAEGGKAKTEKRNEKYTNDNTSSSRDSSSLL
jgi:hypothetical protein